MTTQDHTAFLAVTNIVTDGMSKPTTSVAITLDNQSSRDGGRPEFENGVDDDDQTM